MKKKLLVVMTAVLALSMTLAFAFTACGTTVTVTISQKTAEVVVGKTVALTATASDESEITWSTSDKDIATVSSKGVVAGVKAGTATITATSGSASATCTVTVTAPAPATTVSISKATETVDRDKTVTLTATASDGSKITWSSSDPGVATVKDGVVTGVTEGTAVITAASGTARATCTVTVTDLNAPADYYKMEFSEEAKAVDKTWCYWNNQGWVAGGVVTVTRAEHRNATVTVAFSGNDALEAWFGMQLFYKDSDLTLDENYKLTCKINTTAAGDVTINGNVVSLKEGDNDVAAYFRTGEGVSAFAMQFGVSGKSTLSAATVAISEMKWETFTPVDLAAPSLAISEKTVTITDEVNKEGVGSYELGFFLGDEATPKYKATIENGEAFDDTFFDNGDYTVRIRAVAAYGYYKDSAWSETGVGYSVTNGRLVYDIEFSDEVAAVANPGKWVYWKENTEVTASNYDDGTITFTFANNNGNWYGTQLFFKNSSLTAGTSYTLTMKINSTVAGSITINGTVKALVAGDNEISVNYTEAGDKASVSIQLGVYDQGIDIEAGTLVIDNVAIVPAA